MRFRLVNRAGGSPIVLAAGSRVVLGRSPSCDLVVEDQSVSRRHCEFLVAEDGVTVSDLKSAYGTFVNERAVTRAQMRQGDLMRVGTTIYELQAVPAAPTRPAEASIEENPDVQSVISKRFDPGEFTFLQGQRAPSPELTLLQRAQRHLSTLHSVSEALSGTYEIPQLCEAVLGSVLSVTGAERAAMLLKQDEASDSGEVELVAAKGGTGEPFTVSRTLVCDVVSKGVSTFALDATADERYKSGHSVIQQHIRSVMCVPLRTSQRILGALYVDTLKKTARFTEADLELLSAVGNQAGLALHRARLLSDMQRLLLDTLRAIAATIDAKDGYTHRHSERVAAVARRLAADIGLSPEDQDVVGWSALLHDVGKIAVPDAILNKPGRLSAEEFEAIKQHPAHGARILANIDSRLIASVLPGVRGHHERWDGTGYPDGLKGEMIPLIGRLVGVADFLDALTSARSYRGALPIDDALALMRKGSGTHFDPSLVNTVLALHKRGELASALAVT